MKKQDRLHALENQVGRLERRLEALQRLSYRHSWARIAVFGAGLLACGLAWYLGGIRFALLCLPVAGLAFGAAVYAHRRVERSIRRHKIWRRSKLAQIARARLDWPNIPETFPHQPRPEHPFEADLDLVGQHSLHRLLDTAVTYEGSQRLRDWLTAPVPDAAQSIRRQQWVRELAPLHLFRERLMLNTSLTAGGKKWWKAKELLSWLERRGPEAALRRWLLLFGALVALNTGLFFAHRLALLPPWWQLSFVFYLGLVLLRARDMGPAWDEALALEDALRQLRGVLGQLETFSYRDTPHLKELCRPFLADHRPSRYLARLTRIVAALGLRGNPLLWFGLNALLPWDTYFVYRLNQAKAGMARHAPAWLEAWFELEALGSLAGLAYLNPDYAFPRIVDEGEVFRAEGLGHPLILDGDKVRNDFAVPELGQVTVITGSNMAGKSVFLKTVGLNLALAYAGGPVDARAMQAQPLRLLTCMGISDSVTDGISYFYAEVKRLKWLLDALQEEGSLPLFFGIDEIFRGTNNRERLIGSRAYVRALVGKRGLGLIATHDLELARLAEELPQVVNYHFRDQVAGDRMVFDYTLRPGPCPTTNALKIMHLEGLPVPPLDEGAGGG